MGDRGLSWELFDTFLETSSNGCDNAPVMMQISNVEIKVRLTVGATDSSDCICLKSNAGEK